MNIQFKVYGGGVVVTFDSDKMAIRLTSKIAGEGPLNRYIQYFAVLLHKECKEYKESTYPICFAEYHKLKEVVEQLNKQQEEELRDFKDQEILKKSIPEQIVNAIMELE
jgi:hypothetical protein